MSGPAAWLSQFGFVAPTARELGLVGAASATVVVALLVGLVARRWLGPHLTRWWMTHAGHHAEGIGPRLGAIADYVVSGLLLAIALKGYPWPGLTDLPLGLALGMVVALLARAVLRGLHIPRWMTWRSYCSSASCRTRSAGWRRSPARST